MAKFGAQRENNMDKSDCYLYILKLEELSRWKT